MAYDNAVYQRQQGGCNYSAKCYSNQEINTHPNPGVVFSRGSGDLASITLHVDGTKKATKQILVKRSGV